jgi:ADP-heptose:LPS heptosyltransferase
VTPGAGRLERILLIQPRWMGDVLLCTPAARAARAAFPAARIDFLTEPAGADVLQGNPHIDSVLVSRRGLLAQWRLQRAVRAARYDAVVDFRSTGSTARITALSAARLRVGWRGRGPRNHAYTHLLPPGERSAYVARQKLELLRPLGVDPRGGDLRLEIAVGEVERRRAAEVWGRERLAGGRPVVAVSGVSRTGYKQWGTERWAEVVRALAGMGADVLLTGGPGEREQVDAIADAAGVPLARESSLGSVRELAALYERCALWVGNDGGPKHIAAAVGIPTLTVVRWQLGPAWTDSAEPAHGFLDAAPPGGCDLRCARCPHLACLGAVTVEAVVARARARLLGRAGEEGHATGRQ